MAMASRRLLLDLHRHSLLSSRVASAVTAVTERRSALYLRNIPRPSSSSYPPFLASYCSSSSSSSSSSATFHCPPHQAVVYETHGAPDRVVRLVEIPGRDLNDGEVCVKMLAAPINPSDINKIEDSCISDLDYLKELGPGIVKQARIDEKLEASKWLAGVYPVRPEVPAIGGNEGVGSVVGVGPGVKNLVVNDWVIPAHSTTGTWSTYAIQTETAWYKVPNDLPVEYLATLSVNPSTALRMLKDFVTLQAGDIVVQNGATSMVGQCVIQLANSWGVQTVNLVRDREDLEDVKQRLKKIGATHVFSQSEMEGVDKKALFGGQAFPKLGLNCVGGSAASAVLKLLGEGGTMVTYGGMAKKPITLSTASLIFKDLQLKGFWLQKWLNHHAGEDFLTMSNELLELVRDKKLQYSMEKVPFSSFNTALQKAMGKHGSALKQVIIFD